MKGRNAVLLVLAVLFSACNGSIQSGESSKKLGDDNTTKSQEVQQPTNKKLLFVYSVSAGLMGYFSDSSIAVCPGCDPCVQNVETMYGIEPIGRYYKNNETLITHIGERVDTLNYLKDGKPTSDWLMVDGKWLSQPPNCK